MPDLFIYLLKANIALVLFYLGYRYGLRRLTFYTLNRYFLLLGIVLSATFPLVSLRDLLGSRQSVGAVVQYAPDWNLVRSYVAGPASVSVWQVLAVIFWGGMAVMTVRFMLQLLSIAHIHLRSTEEVIFHQRVRRMKDALNPFSFFGHIYVNPGLHPTAQLRDVIAHEQVHVRGWHSLDIVVAEIHKILYWFNPGVWLMKKAVVENLEFITDRRILRSGVDRRGYQYNLIRVGYVPRGVPMVNHFNLSHLKKRIMMMNRARSTRVQLLRYLLLLPLIAAGGLLISARRDVDRIAVPPSIEAATSKWSGLLRAASASGTPVLTGTAPNAEKPVLARRRMRSHTQMVKLTARNRVMVVTPGGVPNRDSTPNPHYPAALYVVDGKLRDSTYMALKVPPEDISSLSVLKGDAATAIYGSGGAAGVIVVKTKEADKAVTVAGFSSVPRAKMPGQRFPTGSFSAVRNSAAARDSAKGKSLFTLDGGHASGSPLYVVDDQIMDSGYVARRLKPEDIQSISVLKGDRAEKLFGAKGRSGVIMIETRKPAEQHP